MTNFIKIFKLNFKVGKVLAISSFFVFASLLAVLPTRVSVTKAEGCTVYSQAVFNPFPVTWATDPGIGCSDFATLAGGVHNSGNPWSDNFSANAGDTVTLRVYVHNGAATNSGAVMHDVRYDVNLDKSTGSSHNISAQLSASNASGKSGNITINTPANAHLELVSGELSHYIGDKQPCFDFSESFFITIKVVADVVANPNPTTGNITATHDTFCASNGTVNGTVSWTSSPEVSSVKVTVFLNGITTQIGTSQPSGSVSTNWLVPGNSYTFTEYDQDNNVIGTASETIDSGICGGTTPPGPTGTNTITATPGTQCLANGTLPGTVTWTNASDVQTVEVVVQDGSTNNSLTGANGFPNSNSTTNWLIPGRAYTYILYNTTNGAHTQIAQTTENVPNTNCGASMPTGKNTVTATPGTQCLANGTLPGNLAWTNASDVQTIEVLVQDGSAVNSLTGTSGIPNGNNTTNWLIPGHTYTYTLYNTTGGVHNQIAQTTETVPNTSCGTTPPTGKNTIVANPGTQCLANGTLPGNLAWTNASDVQTIEVLVQDGSATNSLTGANGFPNSNSTTNWLIPGHTYTYTLYNTTNGAHTQIAQTTENAPNTNCGGTVTPPTYSVSLSISNFCIYSKHEKSDDVPKYTVIANSNDLVGQKIVWSSTKNPMYPGPAESNAYYLQTLDGTGGTAASWSGLASRAWTSADLGAWTKTVAIYKGNAIVATSQPAAFTVTDCSTVTSPPPTLICSANTATANIGDDVLFTAIGGNGSYTWATSNNSNAGSGSSFHVNFASASSNGVPKTVTVTSGAQSANCGVVINAPGQTTGGNCNNSTNSCNTTTTTTNNNCVNNSCNTTYTNTVYITTAGNTVPANQYAQLTITKSVRSLNNGGSFQNSVSVNNGDTVQFEIVVSNNTGSTSANNVRLTDVLPSGLSLVNGTVQVNGSTVSDSNLSNGMYFGSLSNGQTSRIDFQARVNSNSGNSIQNTANASSDNAGSVQASAWVFVNNGSVLGGNVNLTYSKKAVNETKNADATSVNASREDYITYTLTVSNSGNTPANSFIITDDLSQVLPYSDIVDNGGGSLNGNVITYPGITVPAGGSVSRSFKVRVKYSLSDTLSYVMTNTYGNTVTIHINNPQVLGAFIAPKTGADTNAFIFAGLLTAGAVVFKKRKEVSKIIFT